MGLKSALFGSKPKTKVRQLDLLTPEQKRLFSETLVPELTGQVSEPTQTVDVTKPTVPDLQLLQTGQLEPGPLTGAESVSLTGLEDRARKVTSGEAFNDSVRTLGDLSKLFQQGTGAQAVEKSLGTTPTDLAQQASGVLSNLGPQPQLSADAQQALAQILSGNPQDFEKFFKASVQDPAIRQFQEQVLPQISRKFANQFFGSDRQRADQLATRDLLRSLTEARAGLAFKTDQAARERQAQGVSLAEQDLQRLTQGRGIDAQTLTNLIGQFSQQSAQQGALGQRAVESARGTSLDALQQKTGIEREKLNQLATIMQVSGVPFDRAAQLAGIDIQKALANADISSKQFENALRGEQLGIQGFQANTAAEQQKLQALQLLLQAILGPQKENVVIQKGGSTGLLPALAEGAGQGVGTVLGSKIPL